MPSAQRGQIVKRGDRWLVRWYDEEGHRKARGGFLTRSEALDWLGDKLDEVKALRRGERPAAASVPTVAELVESFLRTHEVDAATTDKLKYELAHAVRAFGDKQISALTPLDLTTWRAGLPARSRQHYFRSFKQVLEHAVTLRLLVENPAARIKNKRVKLDEDREFVPFATWDEIDAIAAELHPRYAAIPVVLVGTGLRPEELFGLERRDLDRDAGVLSVERVYTQGRLKPCMKSSRQRRRVPLRAKVLEALDAMPRRIDSNVLFPAKDGGHTRNETFRLRYWTQALRAAGVEHRRVYDCRHTFAAWSIRAGVSLYYLSRIMGTSVAQIDATYGHLVPDSDEYLRGLLDNYDTAATAAEGMR